MTTSDKAAVAVKLNPQLRKRLVEEFRGCSNLQDLVVGILSDTYGLAFKPSGKKSSPRDRAETLMLRVDPQLKQRIQLDALNDATSGKTQQDVVTRVLCQYAGLAPDPPRSARESPFGGGPRPRS